MEKNFIKLTKLAGKNGFIFDANDFIYAEDKGDYRIVKFKLQGKDQEVNVVEPIDTIYALISYNTILPGIEKKHLNS